MSFQGVMSEARLWRAMIAGWRSFGDFEQFLYLVLLGKLMESMFKDGNGDRITGKHYKPERLLSYNPCIAPCLYETLGNMQYTVPKAISTLSSVSTLTETVWCPIAETVDTILYYTQPVILPAFSM